MLKDIPKLTVENIALAAIPEENETGAREWNIYMVNLYDQAIEGVLVSSTGYGSYEGKEVKTSTLRHLIGTVDSKDYAKVEMIQESLFGLNNEYWVSFYLNKDMYDKKYIFLPETLLEDNFTLVPVINKLGVMLR